MTNENMQPEAFIHLNSEADERVLYPLAVLARQGMSWTVAALKEDLSVESGQEVTLFFQLRQEFMQQAARVSARHEEVDGCEFELELLGNPCSAETRQCYRVVTIVSDRWLKLGDERERCQIVDISATGCAVISEQVLQIGSIIPAEMTHGNAEYRGSLCVQSIKEAGKGRIRYGLHCVENQQKSENLDQGLRLVCLEVQREQLRRLSGAAA